MNNIKRIYIFKKFNKIKIRKIYTSNKFKKFYKKK